MSRIFFIGFFSVFLLLSGCDDSRGPAPVVNAWYQKGAASNFYIVRSEDTIYSIAFAFGLDYRDLVAVNHLVPPYRLVPGQRLVMTHRPKQMQARNVIHATVQSNVPTMSASISSWLWPAKGPVFQRFSLSPWGHPGISIGGRLGEPVRAAASGVVVYSGDGVRGYGNLIIVKHNDSYLSAYAFNQQNLVRMNEYVHAGQVIARMGQNDAGRTLLYFEIRKNGTPVDPLLYLR